MFSIKKGACSMKLLQGLYTFVFLFLTCLFRLQGDDLSNLARALKAIVKESAIKKSPEELWEEGLVEAQGFTYYQKPKVRLIVTSEPKSETNNKEAIKVVSDYLNQNKILFDGSIEVVIYDNAPARLDLRDGIYKNIFVYGYGPGWSKSYIFFRSDGAFDAYQDAQDFSPITSIALVVPLTQDLINSRKGMLSLFNYYHYGDPLGSKYVLTGQSDPCYQRPGTPFPILQKDGSIITVADWLKLGVSIGGKPPVKNPEIKVPKKEEPAQSPSSSKQPPTTWKQGLEQALKFTYKQKPKIRLIISTEQAQKEDQKKVVDEITNYIKDNNLASYPVEIVNYDEERSKAIVNLLDGLYKNIFIFGWNDKSKQSWVFFREIYFSGYSSKPAVEFSPITTLLLVMPLSEETAKNLRQGMWKGSLKRCYVESLSGKTPFGDKYVAAGQTEPFDFNPTIEIPVFKPDGAIISLADWLAWGVL